MKIVADKNIPFLEGVFEPYAEVSYKDGKQICHEDVQDADVLLIRTRTHCDAQLLDGTAVKMIATATIGTDHIDLDYCQQHNIYVHSAAGCNSGGVMQYVFSALYGMAARKGINITGEVFGIVGAGSVGRKVERLARHLGFEVLLCDPPREAAEGNADGKFCSLEELLSRSKVVTLHTPLDATTRGMAGHDFFARMREGAIFINTSRGEVVDEEALLEALPKLGAVAIDTWDHEPGVNRELLDKVDIATPHIAGYSLQGKQNGTTYSVQAVAHRFGIVSLYDYIAEVASPEIQPVQLDFTGKNQGQIAAILQYNYPVFSDDFLFRMDPDGFERIRSEYRYRREIFIDYNMLTNDDVRQIQARGTTLAAVRSQMDRFKSGFPWMKIVAPATASRGICVLDAEEQKAAAAYYDTARIDGKAKFVPASGAASRMFKDLFSGLSALEENPSAPLFPDSPAARFVSSIESFPFYDEALFGKPSEDPAVQADILSKTLTDRGLAYGSKPKGVISFHKYPDGEIRSAIAEHLVEAQNYMRGKDDTARLVVTISPEHKKLFQEAIEKVKAAFEARYGVHYDVQFTYQDKATDTIAVDGNNEPFRTSDGKLLFRPAGHGALIHNLNALKEELVSIKNIDNVACERLLPQTAFFKRVLLGKCLELRDRIFNYLQTLDELTGATLGLSGVCPSIPGVNPVLESDPCASDDVQLLCNEIEEFLDSQLCITLPPAKDCRSRVEQIRAKLNRPIRVCGMVRNQGEPGGGPFIIEMKDGSTSLQILESVQINRADTALSDTKNGGALSATHFNPVDIVCCLHDYKGKKFNLPDYVDEEAGFISSKSFEGRELKALELPGLWNGAMSDWNTLFVEVPLETFNPVKTVLDLLRPAHQA